MANRQPETGTLGSPAETWQGRNYCVAGISLGDSKCWDIWSRGWGMRVWDRLAQKEDGLYGQADLGPVISQLKILG